MVFRHKYHLYNLHIIKGVRIFSGISGIFFAKKFFLLGKAQVAHEVRMRKNPYGKCQNTKR